MIVNAEPEPCQQLAVQHVGCVCGGIKRMTNPPSESYQLIIYLEHYIYFSDERLT